MNARRWASLVLFAATAAVLPWIMPEYYVDAAAKLMILAIMALSMELLLGSTGLVSFGQAAFFGVGAYATVVVQNHTGMSNAYVAVLVAIAAAALVGLAVGALSLRTRGIYFIMVTLAFAQMLYHFAHDTPLFGGSDGMYLKQPLRFAPSDATSESVGAIGIYLLVLAALVSCYAFCALLLDSRFGRALRGIGASERRMKALGYEPYWYKLAAFTIGAAMAGVAGFLYCLKNGAVNPEMMSWHQSALVLLFVIIGGVGRLWGAVAGAAIYVALEEVLSSQAIMGPMADHWLLLLGVAVIGIVAVWPQGFAGLFARRSEAVGDSPSGSGTAAAGANAAAGAAVVTEER